MRNRLFLLDTRRVWNPRGAVYVKEDGNEECDVRVDDA